MEARELTLVITSSLLIKPQEVAHNQMFSSNMQHQQDYFVTMNDCRFLPVGVSAKGGKVERSNGRGLEIPQSSLSTPQHAEKYTGHHAVVTPPSISTPAIRVIRRRPANGPLDIPSPVAMETQKKYYEDSTWRMYDRIQSSRPITLKNSVAMMLPPQEAASYDINSCRAYIVRSNLRQSGADEQDTEIVGSTDDGEHHPEEQEEDDLIFNLEL